jgi:hypothetical protein
LTCLDCSDKLLRQSDATKTNHMKKKFKIRIEYDCEPETKGAVHAYSREQALAIVTANPSYKVTKVYCEEISPYQACLFSDDWNERITKFQ